MKYGSVCSGIEAASVAWEVLGWAPTWFAEVEAFPSAVLNHHWPNVANHGDMTKLPNLIRAGTIAAPDILVGGTPCQAFSVAGRRGSLDDARGNLTLSFIDIADAIDERRESNEEQPSLVVWENVQGILNTKDNAFGCFLAGLSGEKEPLQPPGKRWANAGYISGPIRQIAWRILDAKYFGVPQRRRRVFVVASAGGIDPTEILFERQGLCRDTSPRRNTGQDFTAYAEASFGAYREGTAGGILKRSGGALSGGSKTLVVHGTQDPCTSSYAFALGRNNGGENALLDCAGVRRLTPVECERLQGFPDDHTQIPWRGKEAKDCPDSPRYKAIGNSMAVPVMQWIGKRIALGRNNIPTKIYGEVEGE